MTVKTENCLLSRVVVVVIKNHNALYFYVYFFNAHSTIHDDQYDDPFVRKSSVDHMAKL